jgi:hypothetical protein
VAASIFVGARIFQQLELAQKQVELLTQAFPERKQVAMLFDNQSADQSAWWRVASFTRPLLGHSLRDLGNQLLDDNVPE